MEDEAQRGAGSTGVAFAVYARPIAQGSMRAIVPKGRKRPVIIHQNPRLRAWRKQVTEAARVAMRARHPFQGPVAAMMLFGLSRPSEAHRRPDLDKLVRAILDAITGIVISDDAQVVELHATKVHSEDKASVRVVPL